MLNYIITANTHHIKKAIMKSPLGCLNKQCKYNTTRCKNACAKLLNANRSRQTHSHKHTMNTIAVYGSIYLRYFNKPFRCLFMHNCRDKSDIIVADKQSHINITQILC